MTYFRGSYTVPYAVHIRFINNLLSHAVAGKRLASIGEYIAVAGGFRAIRRYHMPHQSAQIIAGGVVETRCYCLHDKSSSVVATSDMPLSINRIQFSWAKRLRNGSLNQSSKNQLQVLNVPREIIIIIIAHIPAMISVECRRRKSMYTGFNLFITYFNFFGNFESPTVGSHAESISGSRIVNCILKFF